MAEQHAQLAENIRQAQGKRSWPPTQRKVPFRNICDLLSLHSKVSGSKTFLIGYNNAGERSSLSYAGFNARAHQVANFLHGDLGIRRGDCVATLALNHVDTVLVYFACWIVGATVAPQNAAEDDERIAFILRHSEARACFVADIYLQRVQALLAGGGAPNIEQLVVIGGEGDGAHISLSEALHTQASSYLGDGSGANAGDMPQKGANAASASLDDRALLVYTSGTTGPPKGVVLSQYNLLVDAMGISQWQAITGNQRMICVLPIHHVNGIVVTLMTPLYVGASTVLTQRFSAAQFWHWIRRERVHVVSVVPTLLQYLIEYGRRQQAAGHSLFGENISRRDIAHFRHFICGAGTLSVALARAFTETFCLPLVHGYGLSETTCYSCFLPVDLPWSAQQRWLLGHGYPSIGCPIEPNEMAIFAADGSGQRLGASERGEICIRGHNVMQGYYKRPEANAETFKFQWFRSGDEGYFERDEQGRAFFFITGRIKELINRGGVKFSPYDIDETLLAMPGIRAGLAVGFPNTYYGEEVGAYVVLEPHAQCSAEQILAHCRARLSYEKSPKVVVFGQDIPVTSTGKYQRLQLQRHFEPWHDRQFRR